MANRAPGRPIHEPPPAAQPSPETTAAGMRAPASAASYLAQLQLVTGVFTQLQTLEQAVELVVSQCVRALDATTGLLSLVHDAATIDLVHAVGYSPGALKAWEQLPLDAELPLPDVVRRGEALFFEHGAELVAQYPVLSRAAISNVAWAMVPLPIDDTVIGGIVLGFETPRSFSQDDRAFLLALAQQCAQAVERARLYAAEQQARAAAEAAHARTALVAETARLFASAQLDLTAVLALVTQRVAEVIGDACGVRLISDDGTCMLPATLYHPNERAAQQLRQLDALPVPLGIGLTGKVAVSGETLFMPEIAPAEVYTGADPTFRVYLDEFPIYGIIMIPLRVRAHVLGVLSVTRNTPNHPYTADELHVLNDLADRAALAIDNARLYQRAQVHAERIQRLYTAEQQALHQAEEARRQLGLLAEASAELAASLDIQTTLETIARLLVPDFADWSVLDMYADDGSIQTMVVAHTDPNKEALGWQLVTRYPIDPNAAGGTAAVLRTRQPELVPEITDEVLAVVAIDAEHMRMLKELGIRSSVCVPLIARGRAFGTIALVAAESGRRYSAADLPILEELARRAAQAIDNARLYRESQEAVRLRDTFFSVAAHELKTPLTSLLGQAQLLLRRAERSGELSERDQRSVRVIESQATRLNTMILAMLDSARLEHGQLSIERQPVNLGALVERVVAEMQPTLDRHVIELGLAPGEMIILGDALRLEQVLQNLIGNAVKYSPSGGRVFVRLAQAGAQVHVEVQDTGIGIPEAALPLLFQRFYRANNVSARHISGMGIGLYVVKEIVALHGGTVTVESQEGQGSTFRIQLPLGR